MRQSHPPLAAIAIAARGSGIFNTRLEPRANQALHFTQALHLTQGHFILLINQIFWTRHY